MDLFPLPLPKNPRESGYAEKVPVVGAARSFLDTTRPAQLPRLTSRLLAAGGQRSF